MEMSNMCMLSTICARANKNVRKAAEERVLVISKSSKKCLFIYPKTLEILKVSLIQCLNWFLDSKLLSIHTCTSLLHQDYHNPQAHHLHSFNRYLSSTYEMPALYHALGTQGENDQDHVLPHLRTLSRIFASPFPSIVFLWITPKHPSRPRSHSTSLWSLSELSSPTFPRRIRHFLIGMLTELRTHLHSTSARCQG